MEIFSRKEVFSCEKFKIFCIKIKTLEKKYTSVKNWRFNRRVDSSRVDIIKNNMIDENLKMTPGLICAWETEKELEIYDGFHRYSACRQIEDCKILIKITSSKDEEIIKRDFENVNKSLYVPAMYMDINRNEHKIEVCEKVYSLMKKRFPDNVSFSNSPQQQNFNKNSIIHIVSNLKIDYYKDTIAYEIYDCLMKANSDIKNLGLRPRYYKTTKTGFWLFFWSFDKIIEYVNKNLG